MPAGRPTKYKPEYCEQVIEIMSQGLSLTAFAGKISVARSSINEWIDNHEEFSEAVRVGKAKRTLALEMGMLSADSGPAVTARMFALKNADPDEWREKQSLDLNHGLQDSLKEVLAEIDGRSKGLPNG